MSGNDGGEVSFPESSALRDRYRVVEELGRGAQGRTLLVEERETGRELVTKQIWVGPLEDWKSVELFERSAEILEELDHDGIPAYVDHVAESGDQRDGTSVPELYLVREHAEGDSLLEHVERGWRPDSDELLQLADELLDILEYLHGRDPPVVHRDVKPSNIIRGTDGSRVHLVDFGTAQARILDEVGGSTMAGTSGYVPFEQLAGRALPSSDLYALGATLIHLASHRHPAELTGDSHRIEFDDVVDLPDGVRSFLRDLTAPTPGERIGSTRKARKRIDAIRSGETDDTTDERKTVDERPGRFAAALSTVDAALEDGDLPWIGLYLLALIPLGIVMCLDFSSSDGPVTEPVLVVGSLVLGLMAAAGFGRRSSTTYGGDGS